MEKTNRELFEEVLLEGANRRIDREIAEFDEAFICSNNHIKNMARILNGKGIKKPLNRKMIAILVAAAILLLAGCGVIFRQEIREFITNIKEFFVEIRFDNGENESRTIDEIYELTYLPEGYKLEKQEINITMVDYIFTDSSESYIRFIQRPIDPSSFAVDIEHGDYEIINIGEYEVYSQQLNDSYYYIWNDGKYSMQLYTSDELSEQTLALIINGINVK